MLELRTDIEIDAPVERVWEVLTDFDRFPDWNPFIRRIGGNAQVGSRLDVFLGASGTRGMRFRPTVTKVVPNRELRWLGRLGLPRLFDGRAHLSDRASRANPRPVHSEGTIPRSTRPADGSEPQPRRSPRLRGNESRASSTRPCGS